MKFDPNKIIDEEDFFNERKCKRCSKSLEGKRTDAIYCSRNCKSIVKRCIKSKKLTIEKWKLKELNKVNEYKKLIDLLKGV
jgi:hypothetical protein